MIHQLRRTTRTIIGGIGNLNSGISVASAVSSDLELSDPDKVPIAGAICTYPVLPDDILINPAVGIYDETQEVGALMEVPLFKIWAFERQ